MTEDETDDGRIGFAKKYLEDLSKGRPYSNDIGCLSLESLQVLRVQRGSILCNLVVPQHLADKQNGYWHVGAMATLIDYVGAATILSSIGFDRYMATVDLNVSFLSTVKIGEKVEIEGKVLNQRGKLSSTIVEIRRKENAEMIAMGKQWFSQVKAERRLPSASNPSRNSKL